MDCVKGIGGKYKIMYFNLPYPIKKSILMQLYCEVLMRWMLLVICCLWIPFPLFAGAANLELTGLGSLESDSLQTQAETSALYLHSGMHNGTWGNVVETFPVTGKTTGGGLDLAIGSALLSLGKDDSTLVLTAEDKSSYRYYGYRYTTRYHAEMEWAQHNQSLALLLPLWGTSYLRLRNHSYAWDTSVNMKATIRIENYGTYREFSAWHSPQVEISDRELWLSLGLTDHLRLGAKAVSEAYGETTNSSSTSSSSSDVGGTSTSSESYLSYHGLQKTLGLGWQGESWFLGLDQYSESFKKQRDWYWINYSITGMDASSQLRLGDRLTLAMLHQARLTKDHEWNDEQYNWLSSVKLHWAAETWGLGLGQEQTITSRRVPDQLNVDLKWTTSKVYFSIRF